MNILSIATILYILLDEGLSYYSYTTALNGFIKLGTHVAHDERINHIDQGHGQILDPTLCIAVVNYTPSPPPPPPLKFGMGV